MTHHHGDPCIHCGLARDAVPVGECKGVAKVAEREVSGWGNPEDDPNGWWEGLAIGGGILFWIILAVAISQVKP